MSSTIKPPEDLAELLSRARALDGCPLSALSDRAGLAATYGGRYRKGRVGALLEAVLGATGGSHQVHDFPALGVELKSIPVSQAYAPRESTFVCTISLADAETAEWDTSWVKQKLACVLWVPIVGESNADDRRVGRVALWRPSIEQDRRLRDDFEELMGTIGAGGIEAVTAHMGRALQIRPKAASSQVKTHAFGPDGQRIQTVPRGFYLRTSFTSSIIRPLG